MCVCQGLDASEKAEVERAGDLDGLQRQRRRVEGEGDRVDHLRVHQQLGRLTPVPQTRLVRGDGGQHL